MRLTDPACAPTLRDWAHGYSTEFDPNPPHRRFVRVVDGRIRCYCCRETVLVERVEAARLADYLPPAYFREWVRFMTRARTVAPFAETYETATRPACVTHLTEPHALPAATAAELESIYAVLRVKADRRLERVWRAHAAAYNEQFLKELKKCETAARELMAENPP